MPRTFIRQDTQIRQSDVYDDTVAAGSTMESAPVNVEEDLNSLRSQIKRLFLADAVGDWYQDVDTINSKKRGIKALSTNLDTVEELRRLKRVQILTDVGVTAAQNWEILLVSASETPTTTAAVGVVSTLGAVVSLSAFSGAGFDVHELVEVAGQNAIAPKNLVTVRDATTGQKIQSSGRDVFGLLQLESTAADGATFDDVSASARVKISFVRMTAGLDDLEACPVVDIAGKTVNYSYVRRYKLTDIPEDSFIGDDVFVDQSAATDVTLDRAIDNQSGAATQAQNIDWRISDTFTLDFQDSTGGRDLLSIRPNVAGDVIQLNLDTLDINVGAGGVVDIDNGITVDSGGTALNMGVTAGQIDSAGALALLSGGAADLTLNGAGEIRITDGNRTGSSVAAALKFSDTTQEWSDYETAFGGEVSILRALYLAQTSSARTKTVARATGTINADVNVTGAGGSPNVDAQLGDYSGKTFLTQVDVFVNGELMRNGADASANHDVYPGTSAANGDLKFEFKLKLNDVITMVIN